MDYHAHTATGPGGRPAAEAHWQLLKDHLRGVADFARAFARPLGIEAHAEWCGLHHDLGKYAERFQARLRSPATVHGINHWAAGAVRAWKDRAHLPALVIDGHHTGIPALGDFKQTAVRAGDAGQWHSLTGCPESFDELITRMAADGIASEAPPPRERLCSLRRASRRSMHSSIRAFTSARGGQFALGRRFEEGDHLLPADRGESFEEVVNRLAAFDIIEQRLHRNASACEYRRSAHHVPVARNNLSLNEPTIPRLPNPSKPTKFPWASTSALGATSRASRGARFRPSAFANSLRNLLRMDRRCPLRDGILCVR